MKLTNILKTVVESKGVIDKYRGTVVRGTSYKPQFAFKALVAMLTKGGIHLGRRGKASSTNSYYIEAYSDEDLTAEIRISDHTKRLSYRDVGGMLDGSYVDISGSQNDHIEINIVDADGYVNAKEALKKFYGI